MATAEQAIATLDALVPNPELGLPEEVFLYISRTTPLINVDLLIQDDERRTLLTWRDDDHYGAGWHVPGGIIRYKEHAVDRIRKCAEQEIGCDVDFEPVPVLIVELIDEPRNRGHFISMLYRCRLKGEPDPKRRAGSRPRRGEWMWHSCCPTDLLKIQRQYAHLLSCD